MKKYLLLLVAAASMLASSCLKSVEDDRVYSTTFTGKVMKKSGEPLANHQVKVKSSDGPDVSTFSDCWYSVTRRK